MRGRRGGVQIYIVYITDTHKNCGKVKKICEGRLFSVEQGKGKHLHVREAVKNVLADFAR